jgi:hypothetical protein
LQDRTDAIPRPSAARLQAAAFQLAGLWVWMFIPTIQ